MASEALERVWTRVRDELLRQRGMNRFRGREVHLLPKRQVRIPLEYRKGLISGSEITIHLSEVESELWAIQSPEGNRWKMDEFGYDLAAFISAIVDAVREGDYLHTNSKEATYRKGKEDESK